jgi:5'-3' exonuclease
MLTTIPNVIPDPDIVIVWEGMMVPGKKFKNWPNKERTWRRDFCYSYKANRHAEPSDSVLDCFKQIPRLLRLISILGFKQVAIPRLEADDVIGILSRSLSTDKRCSNVYCLSNDRDMFQLPDGKKVYCLVPKKGKLNVFDPEAVETEFGVPPEKVPWLKALAGDSSDNIKGLAGVGPVRALDMINAGVNPSLKNYSDHEPLPAIKADLSGRLAQEWEKIRKDYQLTTIPRTPDYPLLPEGSETYCVEVIDDVRRFRKRRMTKARQYLRRQQFQEFCERYDLDHVSSLQSALFKGVRTIEEIN